MWFGCEEELQIMYIGGKLWSNKLIMVDIAPQIWGWENANQERENEKYKKNGEKN